MSDKKKGLKALIREGGTFSVYREIVNGHNVLFDSFDHPVSQGAAPLYWNGNGRYTELYDLIYETYIKGRVGKSDIPAIELLRVVGNLYYDKYNNGGSNLTPYLYDQAFYLRTHAKALETAVASDLANISEKARLMAGGAADDDDMDDVVEAAIVNVVMWLAEHQSDDDDDDTLNPFEFIEDIQTEDTGGGCMADVLVLKSGKVIAITEDAVAAYPSFEAWQNSDKNDSWIWLEPENENA